MAEEPDGEAQARMIKVIKRSGRAAWIFVSIVFGIFIFTFIIIGIYAFSSRSPSTGMSPPDSQPASGDLNADIVEWRGIYKVTNKENEGWTDCNFGVNGTGIMTPAYITHAGFSVLSGQTYPVAEEMTTPDGTAFDAKTHSINTIVLICFQNSGNPRTWYGHFSNQ